MSNPAPENIGQAQAHDYQASDLQSTPVPGTADQLPSVLQSTPSQIPMNVPPGITHYLIDLAYKPVDLNQKIAEGDPPRPMNQEGYHIAVDAISHFPREAQEDYPYEIRRATDNARTHLVTKRQFDAILSAWIGVPPARPVWAPPPPRTIVSRPPPLPPAVRIDPPPSGIVESILAFIKRVWNAIIGSEPQGSVGAFLDNPMFSVLETPLHANGRTVILSESDWRQAISDPKAIVARIQAAPTSKWSLGMQSAISVLAILGRPDLMDRMIRAANNGDVNAKMAVVAAGHAKLVEMKIRAEQLAVAAVRGDQNAKARALLVLKAGLRPQSVGDVRSARMVGDALKMATALAYDARQSA